MNTLSLLIKFKYGNKIESKSPSLYLCQPFCPTKQTKKPTYFFSQR